MRRTVAQADEHHRNSRKKHSAIDVICDRSQRRYSFLRVSKADDLEPHSIIYRRSAHVILLSLLLLNPTKRNIGWIKILRIPNRNT